MLSPTRDTTTSTVPSPPGASPAPSSPSRGESCEAVSGEEEHESPELQVHIARSAGALRPEQGGHTLRYQHQQAGRQEQVSQLIISFTLHHSGFII